MTDSILNGYAASVLVAGLMEQGMSAGAATAFLVAGVVSGIAAMAAEWSLVKRTVFLPCVVFVLGGAIAVGAVFGAVIGRE